MLERPALSWAAIGTATTILGIVVGYFIGSSSLSSPSPAASLGKNKQNRPNSYDLDTNEVDDDADEEVGQDGLKVFEGKGGECKLVLIVRTDLGMNKGKIAAQASHATLYNYKVLTAHVRLRSLLRRWESTGQAKIALQANSEKQLKELQAKAMSLGLIARLVRDAGRTQIPAGSVTVLGVGPGPKAVVDEVSGDLELL